jgi:GT2 family glycosyltransferase
VWLPNKLEVQTEYLLAHPRVGFTICRVENFLDESSKLPPVARTVLLVSEQINLNTLVVRREVFERVGGFDPAYRIGHDLDWVARAKESGVGMTILPDVLMRRRIHETNLSYDVETRRKDVFRLLKASVDRRRRHGAG